jgi:lysophospholipase L1-like esterase
MTGTINRDIEDIWRKKMMHSFVKPVFVCFAGLILLATTAAQQPADPCAALKENQKEMESTLRDWPNLAKYRDDDARLGAPAKGESRVVFMGDSITESWALADFFASKPYVNRGISGQTTPQMLLRFRQDVIALQPRVVVILAGTNDIAENTGPITLEAIEDNLMSMVDVAKRNGIRVVFSSLVPAFQYPWRPELAPVEKIRVLNDWIKDYAAKEGLIFLDYYSALANEKRGLRAELTEDGVHPNKAGYAIMAPLAEKAIAAALGKN